MKKTDYNRKINEIEKKITDHDYDKYITTQEFNKLTSDNFTARLAQANLASKNDIADFVKKTDFDDKLKNLNKKVASSKTTYIAVKTKLDDLEKKVKIISTKGLTGDLISKYGILNAAKYFSSEGLQNYLAFISTTCNYWIRKDGSDRKTEWWGSTGMS